MGMSILNLITVLVFLLGTTYTVTEGRVALARSPPSPMASGLQHQGIQDTERGGGDTDGRIRRRKGYELVPVTGGEEACSGSAQGGGALGAIEIVGENPREEWRSETLETDGALGGVAIIGANPREQGRSETLTLERGGALLHLRALREVPAPPLPPPHLQVPAQVPQSHPRPRHPPTPPPQGRRYRSRQGRSQGFDPLQCRAAASMQAVKM